MRKWKSFDDYQKWKLDSNEIHYQVTGDKIPLRIDISQEEEEFICCKELYRQMKKKNISMKCKLGKYDICPEIQELYNENKKLADDTKPFWFLTINPKPEFDEKWEEVWDTVCSFVKGHCYLKEGIVAVEQRGTTSAKGIHYHILASKHNIAEYRLRQNMRIFEQYCDPIKGKYDKVINIKKKDIDYLQDKVEYLKGHKLDDRKPEKVEYDRIWRKSVGLEDYYDFDCLPTRKSKSLGRGGARKGSGVKIGTKRGPYKKKQQPEGVYDPKGSKLKTATPCLTMTF